MSEKETPLDGVITSKLPAFREAEAAAREAGRVSRDKDSARNLLEKELQELLIARSVLRDGKPYGPGDANIERSRMMMGE